MMQKIHKNDFCRDIAIWYDEFLVPGEDFNKSIASALEKCSVFAMTVTLNLVSEDNYVMSIEYPNAKAAGKIIIPTEFVLTNKDELHTKYVDIPECVGLGDDKALTARLLEDFGNIVNKTNDSVPEHNFMIGLAYLNGIDVEVDYEKAMQLITSAAECDFEEAIRKLVYMFRNGEGTKRDLEEAIKWANKLKAST